VDIDGATRYLRQLNIDKDILSMKNFNIYDPMKKGQGLVLDGQTLAHIEVLLNSDGTEDGTLLKLLGRCVTPAGKRLFRIWLCMPLREVSAINARSVRFIEVFCGDVEVLRECTGSMPCKT
jgi:DNA mismatch repair protein MSH6